MIQKKAKVNKNHQKRNQMVMLLICFCITCNALFNPFVDVQVKGLTIKDQTNDLKQLIFTFKLSGQQKPRFSQFQVFQYNMRQFLI